MVSTFRLPPDQSTLEEGINRIQGRAKQLSARVHAQTERATHEFDALRAELESVLERLREAQQQVNSFCNSMHICTIPARSHLT
jgi:uncharacterized protein involved in exopolysaccharide biosynthesis